MSEADKLFEEIGYKKILDTDVQTRYQKVEEGCKKNIGVIVFDHYRKDAGGFFENMGLNQFAAFRMEELLVINKKCEELGWI